MIKQRDAKELAQGYLPFYRSIEVMALVSFLALIAHITIKLIFYSTSQSIGVYLSALFVGLIASDFITGFVHWAADTWGTADWPFVGKTLIRPFREHHVDPLAMTRHDLVESTGSNCLVTLPALLAVELIPLQSTRALEAFIVVSVTSMVFFVFLTAHIHKWAHLSKNPFWIRALQASHLILTQDHHQKHHDAPFTQNYCMTTGWLNPILNQIQFFPKMEKLITHLTGALPRRDDIGETAARTLIQP